ncbi:coilin isoform X1 [Brachyhypopomus gauderio]|uniref:coilin isoform X1 n=1 Tax=Brachyhypopomus gauderio TaxID=698409 RepID=UPI004041269F
MAATCLNAVRVKLYFDYSPPSLPDCRMSWLLVDLNKCRYAADLAGLIREKFDYSRKTVLDLFIEDCYVPPSESIYVIRDNDSIRVKVSSVCWENAGAWEHNSTAGKKRCRDEEQEEDASPAPTKKKHVENQVNGFADKGKKRGGKEKKKRKKKKEEEKVEKHPEAECVRAGVAAPKTPPDKCSNVATNREPAASAGKRIDTADSSDSSEDALRKPPPPKLKATTKKAVAVTSVPTAETGNFSSSSDLSSSEAAPAAGKASFPVNPSRAGPKPLITNTPKALPMVHRQPSSDSSSSSSSPMPLNRAQAPAKTPPVVASSSQKEQGDPSALSTPVGKQPQRKPESSDSYSSSETELVIRRPNPQAMGLTPAGVTHRGGVAAGRGRGDPRGVERGRGRGGGRGGYGKARGTPWKQGFHYNYESRELKNQEDSQTNKSLVLQNPVETTHVPKQDYSLLPLLAAPPAVGQKIAFKLLELTESYTPEVSGYKEGKILGFNHATNMIELQLLTRAQARSEPGKFDLVYQNPDGSERVEYAITQGSQDCTGLRRTVEIK